MDKKSDSESKAKTAPKNKFPQNSKVKHGGPPQQSRGKSKSNSMKPTNARPGGASRGR